MDIVSTVRSGSVKLKSNNKASLLSRSNTAEYGSLFWTFDPNNHYLSNELAKLVYSKWVLRIVAASGIWLCFALAGQYVIAMSLLVIFSLFIHIPWNVMVILSFNRDASGIVVRSGEFWIKIIYAAVHVALEIIHYHYVGRKKAALRNVPEFLVYTCMACIFIDLPLFMVIVGGTDAIPKMKYKWKAIVTAIVAFMFTVYAIVYQFAKEQNDYIIRIQATESMISFHALRSNTCGMLAMFLWKQVIDVMRNKGRCISISYKPYLRWETLTDESESVQSVIPDPIELAVETAD